MALNGSNIFNLTGQVVAITGGYGYLGRSISNGLRDHGATVVVLGRDLHRFREVFHTEAGINFVKSDVSSTDSVKSALHSVSEMYGRIDTLINNAHYGMGGAIDGLSDEAFAMTLDGTIGNYHRCMREVLPYFRSQGYGNIINVSSMYGMVSPDFDAYRDHANFTNPPHYGAGKAAIIQITKYFAQLLGPESIRVNAISPGPFPSEGVQKESSFLAQLKKRTALKRIGRPAELVGAFTFLASTASSYVTGQNLVVDGGWTIT